MNMISRIYNGGRKAWSTLVAGLLVCGVLTSCDSYLTDEPHSQIRVEEAYSTLENLKNNALLTVYNYIGAKEKGHGLQGMDRGLYDLNSLTTDEQIIPTRGGDWYDGGLWYRLFFHTWEAGEGPLKDTWNYLYKVIYICNEGIEHIDGFRVDSNKEQDQLDSYKAELRAVRAMYYFYLMDLFGRVPLVTHTDIESEDLELSDRRDLFYWIYNELNEAIVDLPLEFSQFPKTEYYGRMTVSVAYFVMMKMALNAEIYTDNCWTDQDHPDGRNIKLKTINWTGSEKVEANAWKTVENIYFFLSTYYSLMPNYADNFDVGNEASKENIFVIPMDPILYSNKYDYFVRSRHYCHGAALGGRGDNGACATISTMLAFGYSEQEDAPLPDARLDANFYYGTVFTNGQVVCEDDGVTPLCYHPMEVTDFDISGDYYEKTAGARLAKYSIDATSRDDRRLGNNDIVLFRFADAVLMYAEALYRMGENKSALSLLNMVYQRSNKHASYDHIDDDVLLRERLKELMWEGWRRNDLIRFRRYHKPYDLKVFSSFEQDAHTTVFPIPADMMVMHPNWIQNDGY